MKTLSYPYKPPNLRILFGMALVFGLGALVMGYIAMTNDSGLVINGAHLSRHGATIFYGCFAAASAAYGVMFFPVCILAVLSPRRLTLTSTEISLTNHKFWHRVTVVPLADIKNLDIKTIQTLRFLNIHHSKGKLTISEGFLPDAAAFEELYSAITGAQFGSSEGQSERKLN
jgi:hypothetical protein